MFWLKCCQIDGKLSEKLVESSIYAQLLTQGYQMFDVLMKFLKMFEEYN